MKKLKSVWKEKQKSYLANIVKEDELFYFNTVWAENVTHINIGTEERPYYVPQEMFKVTDSFRDYLLKNKL